MSNAFQSNAFQNNAFQVEISNFSTAFQQNAFQSNPLAFQIQTTTATVDRAATIDGKGGGWKRRHRSAEDELTEAEVQFMHRKLAELKRAKTEKEKVQAAKSLEVALAQATRDDEAADVISETIEERQPEAVARANYAPVMKDIALLSDILAQLDRIVQQETAIRRRRLQDEDDIEMLMMML